MNRQDTSTGAIVIASLIITVMLIVWVGGQNTLIGGRAYEVFFPVAADLGGIGEGDPVRLGGHTISKVESVDVEIPSDNPDKPVVVVGFRLPDSVPLRNGAQVEVQPRALPCDSCDWRRLVIWIQQIYPSARR